jgi:hypothetical protein
MRLGDVPYEIDFYWKGKRYKQMVKPKRPAKKAFTVAVMPWLDFSADLIDMPSGRIVKPVVRLVG